MVGTGGFEPPTCRLGGDRSIHLSYVPGIPYCTRGGKSIGPVPAVGDANFWWRSAYIQSMQLTRMFCVAVLAAAGFSQSAPARLEFEVSSVKPAPLTPEHVNIGIHIDGAQVHAAQWSLKDFIQTAFRVKNYQIEGPDWLSADRFDVSAKIPDGGTRDQVPQMLQSLLADRFGLKVHRATKDLPVYALLPGSDGPKLAESPADPEGAAPCKEAVDVKATGGRMGVYLDYGCGSYFSFANDRMEGKKLAMVRFVDILGRFTDRPVVDMTKLTGRYDFVLDLSPEDYRSMLIRSAVAAGVSLPPEALRMMNGGEDSLMMSLRRLGLKLEARKAPQEVLVVDEIHKTPTEN